MLLGEVPDRNLFRHAMLEKSLQPYFYLTLAVRSGDLGRFQSVLAEYQSRFIKDKTYALIGRLHQNVLKIGLKRLNVAYSRIPLNEVCSKLCLPSVEDAEFVIMKAVKDEVIHVTINPNTRSMETHTIATPYYTQEPQHVLHERIQQCQILYNESIKSMRFPDGIGKKRGEKEGEGLLNEMELLEEYMNGDEDDGMDF